MDAFEDLRNQVWADRSPVGPIEEFHVDRIVTLMWKLQRLTRVETALLDLQMQGLKAHLLERATLNYEITSRNLRVQPDMSNEAAHAKASEVLTRAKNGGDPHEVLLARVFYTNAEEGDALAKLARYEKSFERSLYQALDELRQLQDRRRHRPAPPISDAVTLAAE